MTPEAETQSIPFVWNGSCQTIPEAVHSAVSQAFQCGSLIARATIDAASAQALFAQLNMEEKKHAVSGGAGRLRLLTHLGEVVIEIASDIAREHPHGVVLLFDGRDSLVATVQVRS